MIPDPDLLEARFSLYLEGVPAKQIPWRRPLWWVHLVWPGLLGRDETVAGMAERIGRPLVRLLADFPGESGACVSHGDPIQAFWIRHRRRPVWAIHRLQCAKGGLLILDYDDGTLAASPTCPRRGSRRPPPPPPAARRPPAEAPARSVLRQPPARIPNGSKTAATSPVGPPPPPGLFRRGLRRG